MNPAVARCHECGYMPSILVINGEEETLYCAECAKRMLGDMVIANENTAFRQEKRNDGLILVIAE